MVEAIEKEWHYEDHVRSEFAKRESPDFDESSREFSFMLSRLVMPRLVSGLHQMLQRISNRQDDHKNAVIPQDKSYESVINYCDASGEPNQGQFCSSISFFIHIL